ncbi:glycosyltransferase family 2 protein [Streptomyces niveiscabiei]|uniref:glycosyltransferase family 2 protein n=1 Tax=Streptomyces niveiscabiei TaxID=164115 RepID=UPI0029BB69BF|nr:glycosyltransferase family 2 protein [Streptomyces niveiscabiei]MDX3388022.1 glycosyltransferase family 2 protein [Streptomyces niveiscabiei]
MTGFLIPTMERRPDRDTPTTNPTPADIVILVPMYRESLETCERSATGMLRLDYPREHVTILWLIPEGDTRSENPARTAFAALAEAGFDPRSRVWPVPDMRPKGRALNHALDGLGAHDIVLFLDADVMPGPTQLTDVVREFEEGADIVEAFEFQESRTWVGRTIAAENATHIASMIFLQRRLGTAFLQGSSVYVSTTFLAKTGGFIEDEAEECFVWSMFASRHSPNVRFLANFSYGAPIDELATALRQRVRWLRGQLAALKHLPSPRLTPAGRVALGMTGASIVAQLAVPPALLLAGRGSRTRRLALAVLGLEAARIARTAVSPEWRHLGIRDGWCTLLVFEVLQGAAGWRAVLELATDNRVWHSVRSSGPA